MISDASSGGGGANPPKKKKSAISSLAGAMADAAMAPIKGIAGATGRAGRMVSGGPLPINKIQRNTAPPVPRTDAGGRSGFGATKKPYTKYSV